MRWGGGEGEVTKQIKQIYRETLIYLGIRSLKNVKILFFIKNKYFGDIFG